MALSPCYQTLKKMLEKLLYKRLYTFLNQDNVICDLQFGLTQQYSTSLALINTMGFAEFQMIGLNPICLITISMCL